MDGSRKKGQAIKFDINLHKIDKVCTASVRHLLVVSAQKHSA